LRLLALSGACEGGACVRPAVAAAVPRLAHPEHREPARSRQRSSRRRSAPSCCSAQAVLAPLALGASSKCRPVRRRPCPKSPPHRRRLA
jgi:hypothetical protein